MLMHLNQTRSLKKINIKWICHHALCFVFLITLVQTSRSQTSLSASYHDPFLPAATLGAPSQPGSTIAFYQSFKEQKNNSGVLDSCFTARYQGTQQGALSFPVPPALENGSPSLSIEFWMRIPVGFKPYGNVVTGPGFQVFSDWQWGNTPNGAMRFHIILNRKTEMLQNALSVIGNIGDGQWHQYACTSDSHTVRTYLDGEPYNQQWFTNHATSVGPMTDVETCPTAVGVGGVSADIDELRLSTTVLTPLQVRQNFENYRHYSTILFAAPDGKATNPGTQASPMSLAQALTRVGPNVKIVLLPGNYANANFMIISRGGVSPLNHCLITGQDGAAPATLSIGDAGRGSATLVNVKHLVLRNLTFSATNVPALTVLSSPGPVQIDACRLIGNQNGLVVNNCAGVIQITTGIKRVYTFSVTVQNSVINVAGTGLSYLASPVTLTRNNTFAGGTYGIKYDSGSTSATLLNTILSGQQTACLFVSPGSRTDFTSDGNIYDPGPAGFLVNWGGKNYLRSQLNDYVKDLYLFQFPKGLVIDANRYWSPLGRRSEQRSLTLSPRFNDPSHQDYRLQAVPGNAIDVGIEHIFLRDLNGYAPLTDATGTLRPQGNGVDVGAYETVGPLQSTFMLNTSATTSAGVYGNDGTLVRTLWSGQPYPAQSAITAFWNGLDDQNRPVAPGTYTIKLLSHNVSYDWEGGAGNNSAPITGPTAHTTFHSMQSLSIAGTSAFYTTGYNEAHYQLYRFDTQSPLCTTAQFGGNGYIKDYLQYLTTDADRIYAINSQSLTAYNIKDLSQVTRNSAALSVSVGTPNGGLKGIAVQPQGALLFVAHQTDNRVYILNKATFKPYQIPFLSVPSPTALATTPAGDLWIASQGPGQQGQVLCYTNLATAPRIAQTLTGFDQALGLAVSPVDSTLLVADGGTHQQVKGFASNGALLWTLGQAGGYANGPAVTNDKFVLNGLLAWQPDGSFWVGDISIGSRTLKFSAQRQYLDQILYTPHTYCAAVDANNPSRVFNLLTEYRIDYSKPYTAGQGWTPVNYWGYYLGKRIPHGVPQGSGFVGLISVVTLGNGRTYATVSSDASPTFPANSVAVMELTAAGLRFTGTTMPYSHWLAKDGSFQWSEITNGVAYFYRMPLTGFDALGNPIWQAPQTIASTPYLRGWDAATPTLKGQFGMHPFYQLTDTGKIVTLEVHPNLAGYHLGLLDPITSKYLWMAAPAVGPLNGYGNFDTDCGFAASRPLINGDNVLFGFFGEFWQNSEANQFMHYSSDGLFIGQFGQPLRPDVMLNANGAAGNSFCPDLVSVGSDLYLYHNDEDDRGSHRWKISGLGTISRQTARVTIGP